jgi:hypothetical protein
MKILNWEISKAKKKPPQDSGGRTSYGSDAVGGRKRWNNIIERMLYRELRYNIPVIDTAIKKLSWLNGTLKVYGANDRKQRALDDFFYTVPVRNADFAGAITNYGVNEYLYQLSAMSLEQGFAIGEQVRDERMKFINRLQVPDALSFSFRTEPGGKRSLWQQQFAGQKQIVPDDYVQTFAYDDRAGEYYSLLWNLEPTSDILIRIWQSVEQDWMRFGVNSILTTVTADAKQMEEMSPDDVKRAHKILSNALTAIMESRMKGKTRDASIELPAGVTADQQIVGVPTKGQLPNKRTFSEDQRVFAEQLTVVTGLPPWMLNQHWSTTEALSKDQVKMLRFESEKRQTKILPIARKCVRNYLDSISKAAWIEGSDYWFEWDNVSFEAITDQAQSRKGNEDAEKTRLENISFRIQQQWITPEQGREESERRPYTN